MTTLNRENGSSSIPDRSHNLWDNDFVQSLETPYGEPEYRERAETLVNEVKILLKEMQTGYGDLIEWLQMVDALECLGIDRYFQAEIKEALDYVYQSWDESVGLVLHGGNINGNLSATALGLRLLRIHRYDVSADVLENFKDKDGMFLLCEENKDNNLSKIDENVVMRSMLNLLRCSSVAFPGETVMEEAKAFSSAYLKQILEKPSDTYKKGFSKEVEYAVLYEWHRTFSRWEAHNYIEIYKQDISRIKDKRILELAKLNFNILQFVYKMEMKKLSDWWTESGVWKLIPTRQRTIEYLLLGVGIADEIEFSSSRIAAAKITTILTVFDDLVDEHLTLEQTEIVTKAIVKGWDASIIENIPKNFRTVIEFAFKTVHELAIDATIKQGRDMMPFITKTWTDYIEACLTQAQWNKSGYVPTYDEYIKIGATTAAAAPIALHAILLATPILANSDIEKIINYQSRFHQLIWLCTRLVDDVHDFQDDKLNGQTSSAISSYMKIHPELSEDESLSYMKGLLNRYLKELTWEYLNPNNLSRDWEEFCFNLCRGMQCFYVFGDGFCYHDNGVKERVLKVLIEPAKI